VKVIRIPETSQETHDALLEFGKAMEKTTVEAKVRSMCVCCVNLLKNTHMTLSVFSRSLLTKW